MTQDMSFSQDYSFSAPPEVVFNSLVDPDRTARWLPPGVSLQRLDSDRMVMRADGRHLRLQLSIDRQSMRINGQPANGSGSAGSVHVGQSPAGGSTVRVEIEGVDAGRVQAFVDDAVQRLQSDVSDNFNAG